MLNAHARESLFHSISPNIKGVITSLEGEEQWTFIMDESPDVYAEISSVVESIIERGGVQKKSDVDVYDRLVIALSSISFSYSIIALSYLDEKKDEQGKSLAESIFEHACCRSQQTDGVFAEAKIIKDRVQLFVESGILVSMFSGLLKEK